MMTLTNTTYGGTLDDAAAEIDSEFGAMRASYVQRIGYEVEHNGEIVTLYPAHDQIGVGAMPGDVVEVTTLGLGTQCRVLRRVKGYPRKWEYAA